MADGVCSTEVEIKVINVRKSDVASGLRLFYSTSVYNGSYALNGNVISSWTLRRCRLLFFLRSTQGLAMSHMNKKCIFFANVVDSESLTDISLKS